MKRFIKSTNHAIAGLVHAFRAEGNMRIHFTAAIFAVVAGVLTSITRFEMMALCITISFVIFAELMNTAVEAVVDLITGKFNENAKIAKNVAAGAVLIAAINALAVGYLIFYRKIKDYAFVARSAIVNAPAHITFACIAVVALIVIALKAFTTKKRKGSYIQGGMPSGHSALAFSICTAIAIMSGDLVVSTFAVVLALIVAESRLETNVHSFTEVVVGALIGVFATVILFEVSELINLG